MALIVFSAGLPGLPCLKLLGGALLLWIGANCCLPKNDGDQENTAASRDSILLLPFGLAASIPFIVTSSQPILRFMGQFPLVVTLGAGLPGCVAVGMIVTDILAHDYTRALVPGIDCIARAGSAVLVVFAGRQLARRESAAAAGRMV